MRGTLRWTFRAAAAVTAALALAALPAEARVFQRFPFWGRGAPGDDEALGRVAYRAKFEHNGGRGELTVIGVEGGPREVLARFESAFRGAGRVQVFQTSPDAGMGLAFGGGRITRAIALTTQPGRTVLFLVRQTEAAAQRSAAPSPIQRLEGIPYYPGSTPATYVRNEETRTAAEVSVSRGGAPSDILAFFQSALPRAGWKPALPASQGGSGTRVLVFQRGADICCVAVGASEQPGEYRITVLEKRAAVK